MIGDTNRRVVALIGILLILVGCALLYYSARNPNTGWYVVFIEFLLVLVGVVLVAPERARDIGDLLRSVAPFISPTATPGERPDAPQVAAKHTKILGSSAPPPGPGVWDRSVRPFLHQAAHYSTPTYYLNTDLRVIDWNVGFDLVFSAIVGRLRNKHVNWFIAQLSNRDAVFERGLKFSEEVLHGRLPYTHSELLEYDSQKYGSVRFHKVAVQLNDSEGRLQGWAVGLLVLEAKWSDFLRDLDEAVDQDKLWSVYSGPYDRVLMDYPRYQNLIADVIKVIPSEARDVADLGAGSGNTTLALAEKGYQVRAVENNIGMLDRLREKTAAVEAVEVMKSSVEHLEAIESESFDAATMLNVLYAVDDPLKCLIQVNRILRPGGFLGLSTTCSGVKLDALLDDIAADLENRGMTDQLKADYATVRRINKHIEQTIGGRYSVEQYQDFLTSAGFEVLPGTPFPAYHDAVFVFHARKRD